MNLRRKTFLILAVALIIMTLVVYVGVQFILLNNYEALEKQRAEVNVKRCLSVLSNELSEVDSTAADWAAWDDTYAFIQDANDNYVESNLVDDTFVNLRLNVMLFINSTGDVVYGKAFNLQSMSETSLPQDLLELLSANDFLWYHADVESSLTGIVPLQEAPLLIASKPILSSQSEGPIQGALIIGRYLNSEEIRNLEKTIYLPVVITPLNESATQIPFQSLYSSPPFEDTPIFTRQLNADTISGYALIKNVYGDFSFMLRVDIYQDIYKQGVIGVAFFILALLGSGVLFGLITMLIVEKGFLSRIEDLAMRIKKMGKSKNLSERLSRNNNDELSLLADAIDSMMEERINTIVDLAAMIGHDLRNPLTGITSATYYLGKKYGTLMDEKGRSMLEVIEKDIVYSNKIINDLLDYSKAIKLELKETSPKLVVADALSNVDLPKNVQLIDMTENTPTMKMDTDKMKRVFVNIIKNAVDAMPNGGKLTITSGKTNDKVKIAFADTGVGISEENLKKLFGPLFTTKAKGMGFGLAICKRVVEAHGGTISVESIIDKGTTFTIIIPVKPKLDAN